MKKIGFLKEAMLGTLCLVLFASCCWVGSPSFAQDAVQWKSESWEKPVDEDMQKRLALLHSRMEKQLQARKIPGLALAVVKDGEIIFARGFGVSDVEAKKPVTQETLFAIGSSTKAFTATVIGMLADEDKIEFDDPVSKHVPDFSMKVDGSDEQVTVRDLLSHRAGFTRMGILWAAGKLSRPEVLQIAKNAEPVAEFRKEFHYNNVMYMAAGYSAGQAADSTWEDLIAQRVFEPLGMNSSNTSVALSKKDSRLSLGYVWDKDKESFKRLPMRDLNLIGPAGSINSNIMDMSQWIKFQLANGQVDGKRLISEESLAETRKKQIAMGDGDDYGLGWMLRKWNGKDVVEHGGNIDGFAAQVSMLPKENLGYVMLSNVTVTPLQGASIDLVFDTLLGTLKEDSEAGSAEGIDETKYTGDYIANAGVLRDAKMKVLVQNGNLAIDVPGQMVYELKAPDKDGKWYFAATNAIALKFNEGKPNDKMRSMVMHQAGMEFECPRDGVEMPIEFPLEEMQQYLGTYRDEDAEVDVTVLVKNNHLTVDPGQQAPVEFFPPNEDGWWAMRAKREVLQLKFAKDEDGKVVSVTRKQGGKEVEMKRISDKQVTKFPTGKEVVKLLQDGHRGELLQGSRGKLMTESHFKFSGTANFVNQGATGTAQVVLDSSTSHRSTMDFGKMGSINESIAGDQGWAKSSFAPFEKLEGQKLINAQLRHPLWFLNDLSTHYENFSVSGSSKVDDRDTWELKLQGKAGVQDRTLFVDQKTGLLLREATSVMALESLYLPITINYSDYRSVGGFQMPFSMVTSNSSVGDLVLKFQDFEILTTAPDYSLNEDEPQDD